MRVPMPHDFGVGVAAAALLRVFECLAGFVAAATAGALI